MKENPLIEDNEDIEEYDVNRYFNANFINSNVYSCGPAFIASQSPNSYSISSFWQMVWESNVKLITMLCPLGTEEKEESIEYWKTGPLSEKVRERVTVKHLTESHPVTGVVKRQIVITDGVEDRILTHL